MQIPLTIDQALIILVGAFAFRSYLRFDKAADKIEAAALKFEKIEEKLESIEVIKTKHNEMEKDIGEIKHEMSEMKRKYSGQYSFKDVK